MSIYIPSIEEAVGIFGYYQQEAPTREELVEEFVVVEPWNKGLCDLPPSWNKGRKRDWLTEEQLEYNRKCSSLKLKGTKQSEEHKLKKAKSLSKSITIDGVSYTSQKAAAAALNCSEGFIKKMIDEQGGSRDIKSRPMGANQYTR